MESQSPYQYTTTCGGQDPNMMYALRRAVSLTLSFDGHLNDSKATLHGSPWGANGPPLTTSEENQLLQLDLHYNNSHDHHHKLQHPHFYPVTPTMLCFLLCTTRFHATSIVNVLYNDDATGPSTAPDCLPRDSCIGDRIHKQSTQDTTFFMPITMRLHSMTTTTSLMAEDIIGNKNDYQRRPILE
jgi:hypothetical protein